MSPALGSFSIRLARADELARLGPLELRAAERFADSAHPYACALPPFDVVQLAERQRAGTVWVACGSDDQLLGFAIAGWLGDEPYLHELDVDPRHARQKIGRALVVRVAEWARCSGGSTLLLSTFCDVPWNAPYYERLGFQVVPTEQHTPAQEALRMREAAAGLRVESRVIMRARLERLVTENP